MTECTHKAKPDLFNRVKTLTVLLVCIALSLFIGQETLAMPDKNQHQLNLLPLPKHLVINSGDYRLPTTLYVLIQGPADQRITKALSRLNKSQSETEGTRIAEPGQPADLILRFTLASPYYPTLEDDESYQLEVSSHGVTLTAAAAYLSPWKSSYHVSHD